MFRKLSKVYHYYRLRFENDKQAHDEDTHNDVSNIPQHIPTSLEELIGYLNKTFEDYGDLVLRKVQLGDDANKIVVVYINGLINKQRLNADILKPIMIYSRTTDLDKAINQRTIPQILMENLLPTFQIKEVTHLEQSINGILDGYALIYIEGNAMALQVDTKGWSERNVDKPITESTVRGPRESFIESLETNISLLRRKIKNPNLKVENYRIGEQSHTNVVICYLKGIVDDNIIKTVRSRLKKIKIDAILDSGYVEQFIEDNPFSIFPTIGNSEKPDRIAAKILEGRVAIFCDGTPTVLTVPYLFTETIQASDDYYSRFFLGSLNRILRTLAFIITISAPGIYIALITFHSNSIPLKLLLSIAASVEGLPFSPFIEALFMTTAFELLKEAGIRMPRPFGQSISIVGALIIGEAAVNASLVSNIMVIIIALTGICSFIIPPIQDSVHLIRLTIMLAANILGFLGIIIILMLLSIQMCSISSFGVPYMSPLAPFYKNELKDSVIKLPIWMMTKRPKSLIGDNPNKRRMKKRQ